MAFALACAPLLTSAAVLNRQLQLGMSGADVGELQTFLAQDRTIYPQGLITGYFGSLTKSAVSNFQARNGISTVGRVGPQTLAFINNMMNSGYIQTPSMNQGVLNTPNVSTSGAQATINWSTNIPTSAAIYYSASPFGIMEQTDTSPLWINAPVTVVHTDLQTSHSYTLGGLNPNATYYYLVYVKDIQGNEHITLPKTFTTSAF